MARETRRREATCAAVTATTTAAVPAAAKGWMGDGMEHNHSRLAWARLHRHSRGMICSTVASLAYGKSWGGGGLDFILFSCFPVSHGDI